MQMSDQRVSSSSAFQKNTRELELAYEHPALLGIGTNCLNMQFLFYVLYLTTEVSLTECTMQH
jgi:hypothetical protein